MISLPGVRNGRRKEDPGRGFHAGVERMTLDKLLPVAERCLKLSPVLALFPVIERRGSDAGRQGSTIRKGLIPRVVARLKKEFPNSV